MKVISVKPSDEMWTKLRDFAENCSWKAGKSLSNSMDQNEFEDWERIIAAIDNDNICGYCTVAKEDCIPGMPYTPYIGYVFVDEKYRGNRLSKKMIEYAMDYLKTVGFDKVFIVSDHINLYEKYGFNVIDKKTAPWGSEEKIYMRKL